MQRNNIYRICIEVIHYKVEITLKINDGQNR